MIEILFLSALSITLELKNDKCYYSNEYEVILNGKKVFSSNKNVFSIYNLNPNTDYNLKISGQDICEELEFKTLNHKVVKISSFEGDMTSFIQEKLDNLQNDEVLVLSPGEYKVVSLFLRDNNNIYLSKDAILKGENDRTKFPILKSNELLNQIPLGTWEGRADDSFSSIITLLGVSNVTIYGEGVVDCDAQNGDWWINHRELRIARRPKGIFVHTSNEVTFEGITVQNTPSWNQHPFYSTNLNYLNMKLINPKNSPTTDGLDPESCTNVNIIGTYFSVGDDCIAIKSGKIEFAKKYKTPSSNIIIRNCLMEDGHGGVTLGSENSAGINNVIVSNCIFRKTDRGLRIKTQRGRGNLTIIKDIVFDNIEMENVKAPFVINMFYKAGNDIDDYRFIRTELPKTELTPHLGKFRFSNIICNDVEWGAGIFLGLPEDKIEEVMLENIVINYKDDAKSGSMAYTLEMENTCKEVFVASNVDRIIFKNVVMPNDKKIKMTHCREFKEI